MIVLVAEPYKEMVCPKGDRSILVDSNDYDYLIQWEWSLVRVARSLLYARRAEKPRNSGIYMHRELFNRYHTVDAGVRLISVQHQNGNTLDNRLSNLKPLWHKRKPLRTPTTALVKLSPKERAVAVWMARGLNVNRIAQKLHVDSRTVWTHLGKMYEKTGTNNSIELIAFLQRQSYGQLKQTLDALEK